jgi:hypothetical protein
MANTQHDFTPYHKMGTVDSDKKHFFTTNHKSGETELLAPSPIASQNSSSNLQTRHNDGELIN